MERMLRVREAAEIDAGHAPGVTTAEAQRIKDLEAEVRELRRANAVGLALLALFALREGKDDEAISFWESAGNLCVSLRKKSWVAACCRIRDVLERELEAGHLSGQRKNTTTLDAFSANRRTFKEVCGDD